ncbi:hypothetical protein GLYMA_02G189900v4 [Glycine max]|uniref:Uncharacterized protein n=2 Tax=Glycine subgen. Soja TaxID=1462606 RepID=A0A0R0L5Y0_SOYBN|nr:hypothetical protein JHK87_004562 [Glycine soja]KAG5063716.1 hypothetical protein JHK85_004899 [Glycine max]KAH1061052.1 hypothetical protein GYH30_004516 [Glycine max]KRH72072.1 hypothetical protein GLYMA_02G189900v4 [Glycine max]RZC25694.1 hypothetical protein D0Y65_004411 [Glycine soja]
MASRSAYTNDAARRWGSSKEVAIFASMLHRRGRRRSTLAEARGVCNREFGTIGERKREEEKRGSTSPCSVLGLNNNKKSL